MRSSVHKRHDMARSILPSKARHSASAALAQARRSNRHAVDVRLRSLQGSGTAADDADELFGPHDARSYPDAEIGRIVRWRRGADKLNHFERWAVEITRDVRMQDRLSHMRAVLPRGLVGEHALSHLRWLPEFDCRPPGRTYGRAVAFDHDRTTLRRFLLDALQNGQHGELNAALKAAPHVGTGGLGPHPVRCLLGYHDIELFLDDLYAVAGPARDRHPEWLAVVRAASVGVTEALAVGQR